MIKAEIHINNRYNYVIMVVCMLLAGCSSIKGSLITNFNDAIHNAVADYSEKNKSEMQGKTYNVSFMNFPKNLIGVSILDYTDGQVFIRKENLPGSNQPYFPTRFEEVNNALFYWHDSTSVVTEELLTKLTQYNHIDSTYYNFDPNKLWVATNDHTKATHYYFCLNDLKKYVKRESLIALRYDKVPKMKCR